MKRLILATGHLLFGNFLLGVWPPLFSVHRPFIKQRSSFVRSARLNHVKRLKPLS